MTDSPNLEVISKEKTEKEKKFDFERRRVPRLCLTGELFRVAPEGKTFSVTDLSPEGMAIRVLDGEDLRLFAVSTVVFGELNLRREKYPIQGRVKNTRIDQVGFQFENISPAVDKALHQYVNPKNLGQELRPIPSSENGALWYHGPSGTDFLLWRSIDGHYRKMAMYVQGTFVHWDTDKGISTGACTSAEEKSEIRGLLRFETLMLRPDDSVDLSKTEVAKTILLSSNLPQDLMKWCVRQLTIQ
jgi:hypothetical protein